ncbi:MAG: M23 family metallopeptidase [Actinomycetota bacterium]
MTGLALPTAAAAALAFCATGAAVVTTTKTQPVTFSQQATPPATSVEASVDPALLRDRSLQAAQDNALAIARADSANWVARAAVRKNLAARAKEAKLAYAQSWRLPVKNYVLTSGFGGRWGRLHAGEDFGVPIGTNLVSMSTGTIVFAGQESGYGTIVKIRYWDGTVSFYGHMSRVAVTAGEVVAPGDVVGQSGNTGESTGPHLHLEIHPGGSAAINPLPWLTSHQVAF